MISFCPLAQVPAVKNLPTSARTLITVGVPVTWFLYSSVATSRNSKKERVHQIHGVDSNTAAYTQAADSSQHVSETHYLALAHTCCMVCVQQAREHHLLLCY